MTMAWRADSSERNVLQANALDLLDLPVELLVYIVQLIEYKDRCSLRHVCKSFCDIVDQPEVWRNVVIDLKTPSASPKDRHVWETLRRRSPTHLYLHSNALGKTKCVDMVLDCCPNLKCLYAPCNILQLLLKKQGADGLRLDKVSLDLAHCAATPIGSCIECLKTCPSLKCLHVRNISRWEHLGDIGSSITENLTQLEDVRIHSNRMSVDVPSSRRVSHDVGRLLTGLPHLNKFSFDGFVVYPGHMKENCEDTDQSVSIKASRYEEGSRKVAIAEMLQSLEMKMVDDVEGIHQLLVMIPNIQKLTVEVAAKSVNPVIESLAKGLPNLQSLSLKAIGLGLSPVHFHLLPVQLSHFSLMWTLGGIVCYRNGVLHQFPRQLCSKLRHLDIPQVRLVRQDLSYLWEEFVSLQVASFSLSDDVPQDGLLELARCPGLRRVRLWYSLKDRYGLAADQLKQLSDNKMLIDFTASMSDKEMTSFLTHGGFMPSPSHWARLDT